MKTTKLLKKILNNTKKLKKRADIILVEKKIANTRSKAQAMIMAGQVSFANKKIIKSGELFYPNTKVKISNLNPQWVSRGAYKLLHALEIFNIRVENKICLDIGASTGGFTEVLLKSKAKKVYSVDVGKNQMHEKLKLEKKIINIEKTNARFLNNKIIEDKIDLIVCDVSFISMKKVIEPCINFLNSKSGIIIGLIKPQFEAQKKEVGRGGIVSKEYIHQRVCKEFIYWFEENLRMKVIGITKSPITGQKGNTEFLIASKFN